VATRQRTQAESDRRTASRSEVRIGLALGSGGARGLAHIAVFQALDEMGIKPVAIAGSSIGAVTGAAYAAGISGDALRDHVLRTFRNRAEVIARLLKARVGRFSDLFARGGNPILVDGEVLLDAFWPPAVPDRFEHLAVPFAAVVTDYHAGEALAVRRGSLVTAVAASMAIPSLVRPVTLGGRVCIDGGAANPLPYDMLGGTARPNVIVAVDVSRARGRESRGETGPETASDIPEGLGLALGASQIMQGLIVRDKLARQPPDILLKPAVERFRALDFFAAEDILAAAQPIREEFRRKLAPFLPGQPTASELAGDFAPGSEPAPETAAEPE
jgi:NTE family protein